jgi:hypothetical protein
MAATVVADPQRPDLADVLDFYEVRFCEDRGGDQAIRCPVHDDAHASASVCLDKQVWHCHACADGGDVYSLIMAKEGMSYKAAYERGKSLTGTSGHPVRVRPGMGPSVAPGEGYRPAYRRKVQTRGRVRPDYGSRAPSGTPRHPVPGVGRAPVCPAVPDHVRRGAQVHGPAGRDEAVQHPRHT